MGRQCHAEVRLLHGRGTVWVSFSKISFSISACLQRGDVAGSQPIYGHCIHLTKRPFISYWYVRIGSSVHGVISPVFKQKKTHSQEFAELHRKNKSLRAQVWNETFLHRLQLIHFPANPLFLAHYLICINIFMCFQVLLLLYSLLTRSSPLIGCCDVFNGTKFFLPPWIQRAVG